MEMNNMQNGPVPGDVRREVHYDRVPAEPVYDNIGEHGDQYEALIDGMDQNLRTSIKCLRTIHYSHILVLILIQLILLLVIVAGFVLLVYKINQLDNGTCNQTCEMSSAGVEASGSLAWNMQNITHQLTQLLQVIGTNNTAVMKLSQDIQNITSMFNLLLSEKSVLQEMQAEHLFFENNITNILKSQLENSDSSLQKLKNITNILKLVSKYSNSSFEKLMNIVGTLSAHKDTSISSAAVIDNILFVAKELLQLQNVSNLLNSITPVSCKDIQSALPGSPSGYYHVNSHNIYCNMEELCGSVGGWTRLAYLDMADSTESCPVQLSLYQYGGVRACGRPYSSGASCSPSLKFPTNGISYSQVCGRVTGYQKGTTEAVYSSHPNDINSYYVDGVSLTRGSPRQHVWTFMAGTSESSYKQENCPCNTPAPSSQHPQPFIESHYFCESGNPSSSISTSKLYLTDPLWDGEQCGTQEKICCSADGLPWFHREYDTTTTDYLELRVCGDQQTINENTPVSFYEIFVK